MDALSHALIGLATAGLSGHQFSLSDPVYLAALLGSLAPDFDIIAQLRSSFSYIRQHRASSHSLPGLGIWSLFIASGIQLFEPQAAFLTTLIWAFAGGLTHIIADYLNTHGSALIWPLKKDRKSHYLLNVFDPVLLFIMLVLFGIGLQPRIYAISTFSALFSYIIIRFYLKRRATSWLQNQFNGQPIANLAVMPSLRRLFFWDFVLETTDSFIIGRIGALYPVIEINRSLPKQSITSYAAMEAKKTVVGNFFQHFTPLIYYEESRTDNFFTVNIYDLRYLINQQFRHRATIIFDEDYVPVASYMFAYGRKIRIS